MVPHLNGAPAGARKDWRPARSRSPRKTKIRNSSPGVSPSRSRFSQSGISPGGRQSDDDLVAAGKRADFIATAARASGRAAALMAEARGGDTPGPQNALPLAAALYSQGGGVPGGQRFGTYGTADVV